MYNLVNLSLDSKANTSPFELAFANYKMNGTPEFNLLMTILEENTSLLALSLARKELTDEQGIKLAKMVQKNQKLRRLELEGNFLGPATCIAFGQALGEGQNRTLRYLDLENNNLTERGTNTEGIKALCEGLKKNTMLISLNLSNNFLTPEHGDLLVDLLGKRIVGDESRVEQGRECNKILIHLEYYQNKDFKTLQAMEIKKDDDSKFKPIGLTIEQIENIKRSLDQNYLEYMKMRTDEWRERKRMTSNYQDNVDTQNIVESQKTIEETRKKEKEDNQEAQKINSSKVKFELSQKDKNNPMIPSTKCYIDDGELKEIKGDEVEKLCTLMDKIKLPSNIKFDKYGNKIIRILQYDDNNKLDVWIDIFVYDYISDNKIMQKIKLMNLKNQKKY